MASKLTQPSLCMAAIFFLLFFSHSLAIRPILPVAYSPSPFSFSVAPNDQDLEVVERINNVEQSCEGIGEEECLMRRTLAAHLDYIYTQKENP